MVQIITDPKILNPAPSLRVRFRKTGALQYISHLDLVRMLTKVLIRSGIPLWYSEGFNPHPRISFATPMSIGLQSLYELMDVKIDRAVNTEAVKEALNRNLTEECRVEEVYLPETRFTDIRFSSYVIEIVTAGASAFLAEVLANSLTTPPVVVLKRSKSGEKETDISPMIQTIAASYADGVIRLDALLRVDSEAFLNPEYLITYMKEKCGILAGSQMEERYSILRTGVYDAEGHLFR